LENESVSQLVCRTGNLLLNAVAECLVTYVAMMRAASKMSLKSNILFTNG